MLSFFESESLPKMAIKNFRYEPRVKNSRAGNTVYERTELLNVQPLLAQNHGHIFRRFGRQAGEFVDQHLDLRGR